ncbi:damage-inducible type I toxin DinQ [Jejubacter calystegiae]
MEKRVMDIAVIVLKVLLVLLELIRYLLP